MKIRKVDRPTQGKWWFDEEGGWNRSQVLTRVPGCGDYNILIASLGGQRETRPNGRLIAASKELRAALIRMLKVTMDHVEACDDWRKMDRAQRAAFAALAKASSSSRIKAKR